MPIDRTGSASRSASEDNRWNPGLDSSGDPGTPTAINPATSRSSSAERGDQLGRPPRLATAATGEAGDIDLHEDGCARSPDRDGPALFEAGHRLPTGDQRGEPCHLVPLHRAEEVPLQCHRAAGKVFPIDVVRFGEELARVVLPHLGHSGGQCEVHCLHAEPFGDHHQSDRTRVRARPFDPVPHRGQPLREPTRPAGRGHAAPGSVVRQIKRACRPSSRRARWEK